MKKPFIYIAALRRTGSTVLSEALILAPYSFIFREPGIGVGVFKVKSNDAEFLIKHGIDLYVFQKEIAKINPKSTVEYFKEKLLPKLDGAIFQVGIKEIQHKHWKNVFKLFPDMKIVLTARNPMDIYISHYNRVLSDKGKFRELEPGAVAAHLNEQFQKQLEMFEAADCLKVRYEDFCTNPSVYSKVKSFVDSEIPQIGAVGSFNAANLKRVEEYELHKDSITDKRVNRWQYEKDESILRDARKTFNLMADYCKFWGYEKP
jgi:hypothetical protein